MKPLKIKQLYTKLKIKPALILALCCSLNIAGQSQGTSNFIENKGQWPSEVLYRSFLANQSVFITTDGLTITLQGLPTTHTSGVHGYHSNEEMWLPMHAIKIRYVNSNSPSKIEGYKPSPTNYNYYLGEKEHWAENVKSFPLIWAQEIYTRIDLEHFVQEGNYKYNWKVKPGADPNQIQWELQGQDSLKLKNGVLEIHTSVGKLVEAAPIAWQTIDGKRHHVPCAFERSGNIISFEVTDDYNPAYDLIIDPKVIFSRYAGATSDNFGYTATFDADGYLYSGVSVFGFAYGFYSFPTTAGAYQVNFGGGSFTFNGGSDIGLTKYDSTGSFMVYSTLLGGMGDELPHSLITDPYGQLYMLGTTSSPDFPVTQQAFDTTFGGGSRVNMLSGLAVDYQNGSDIVVAKISADGGNLLASTFMGGTANDGLNTHDSTRYNYADEVRGEIMLDENLNVLVASCTWSDDFPMANATQPLIGGEQDGVIFRLNNELSQLHWSTFVGGSKADAAYSIKLNGPNGLSVGGGTGSSEVWQFSTGVQSTFNGGRSDGFLVSLSRDGQWEMGTYVGTSAYDQVYLLDTDEDQMVHAFGQTEGPNEFPILNANFSNPNSGQFLIKLNPELDSIAWSTQFGSGSGFPDISPSAFSVDICDKIYLSGWGGAVNHCCGYENNAGYSVRMPITSDAFQATTVDSSDFYLFVIQDDASKVIYGSYFGSPSAAEHVDGGTSRFDKKGQIYQSVCAGCGQDQGFPLIPSSFASDAQYLNNSWNCNNGTFKMDFEYPLLVADFSYVTDPCGYEVAFTHRSNAYENTFYFWEFGDGATSTDPSPVHVFEMAGEFEVKLTLTDTSSCNLSNSSTQTVVIGGGAPNLMDTTYFCTDETPTLGFDIKPNQTYTWSPSDWVSDSTGASTTYTGQSSNDLTLTIQEGSCISQFTFPLKLSEPKANLDSIVPSCQDRCNGRISMDESGGLAPYGYVWSNGSTGSLLSGLCPGRYSFTMTDDAGCFYTDSVALSPSTLDLSPPLLYSSNDTIVQHELVTIGVNDPQNEDFEWLVNQNMLSQTQAFSDTPLNSTYYTYRAFDPKNPVCEVLDSILVTVLPFECGPPYLYVPNAFSPNGDAENDVLYVRGRNVNEMFFAVYNRWGQQVFMTQDINMGWDGTYNGMQADPMVYDWYLKVTCEGTPEPQIFKGNVTLLR